VAENTPNPATVSNTAQGSGIPGSAVPEHPTTNIPLPDHGFETLDLPVRELATVPAVEVISRSAVMLMSASAEKLGLAPGEEPDIDLDEARRLITALAGLLASSLEYLGPHRQPLRDGLRTLQKAFREASAYPDEPGAGPGENLLT
jgi:Domain of unknown function (DUF1844)